MKPVPNAYDDLSRRVFVALCDDLFDIGSRRSTSCDRVNAIHEIYKQERKAK